MLTHSHNLSHSMLLKLKLQLKESIQEATKLILDKSSIQLEPLQVPGLIRILSQLPQEAQWTPVRSQTISQDVVDAADPRAYLKSISNEVSRILN